MHVEMDVEPVLRSGVRLGEGPVWDPDAERLYWVDIQGHAIHRYDPGTETDEVCSVPDEVGVVVPIAGSSDLLAALGRDIMVLSEAFGGPKPPRLERIATLPTGTRANDGACDPAGRFLVGTLAPNTEGACGLYRIDGSDGVDGAEGVVELLSGVTLSNGLDWSPDGSTFYFVDTPTFRVDAFDYDVGTGAISNRRTFLDLTSAGPAGEPLRPDGLTVDAEGGVWVAIARGSQVRRFDPGGGLDVVITLPTRFITSCAFGGTELDALYITSGRFAMTEAEILAEPLAGAVFRAFPGVHGKVAPKWVDVR